MLAAWDATFERDALTLVQRACGAGDRGTAWRELAARVAPHIEHWAKSSRLLRRLELAGEDDTRAVLVGVLSRLAERDFHNLRGFLARTPVDRGDDLAEADAVEALATFAGDADGEPTTIPADLPLRAWLLVLVRFVAKDHAKERFGWTARTVSAFELDELERGRALAAAVAGVLSAEVVQGQLVVCHRPAALALLAAALAPLAPRRVPPRSKRDLISGAGEISEATEPGERPPITDLIALRRLVDETRALLATFEPAMASAFELWLADHDFSAIARVLDLSGAEAARGLVRAAQARLRERLRP